MLPALAIGGFAIAALTFEGFGYAAAGGGCYSLGRKWGRRACELMDGFEDQLRGRIVARLEDME